MPWVTVTFKTESSVAMLVDWTRELGLLQLADDKHLGVDLNTLEVHVGDRLLADDSRDVS